MAFPTSKETFTDPQTTDPTTAPSHAGLHTSINDTVEALEDKVGIDGDTATTSHDYKIKNPNIDNNKAYKTRDNADTSDIDLIKADATDNIEVGTNNSNGHTTINAGTNKLVKIKVLRKDVSTDTYTEDTVILTGWTWWQGDGSTKAFWTNTTFGITFSEVPIVLSSELGYTTIAEPTSVGDSRGVHFSSGYAVSAATNITTTNFHIEKGIYSAPPSGQWEMVSWIAIGKLS